MSRLVSQLAAFSIAAAAAHAGLADASAPTPVAGAPTVELVTGAAKLPDLDPLTERALWGERIEARLAELGDRSPARVPTAAPSYGGLSVKLAALARPASARTRVAVHVRDLSSGHTVFDVHGDRQLNPASNQKLLTSIAAVELLGADYEFETRVAHHDDALYLVGAGDPTLQIDDLHALAQRVVALGWHRGVTRIVVDDSAFSARSFGPGYDPHGAGLSYLAPSGALSLSFNTVEVTVRPGSGGAAPEVEVVPPSTHVRVAVEAKTGRGRGLVVDTEADGEDTLVRVRGALGAGHAPVRVRRRIHDPGLFTGGAFAHVLAEVAGQARLGVERGRVPEPARTVAIHRSLALTDALASALKYSNNFCTEQVLRTLGWRATGTPGSWENGTATVARFWEALGEDAHALRFVNGSGLSRSGRVTPRALVDLLARTEDEAAPAAGLRSTLANAGGEGTLRLRLARAHGRVRAKTGTLAGVSALSGLVSSEDGRRTLGFSILVNGGDAARSRALQDRMVLAMLDELDAAEPAAG